VRAVAISLWGLALVCQALQAQSPGPSIRVTRVPKNPLITVDSSPTLGVNVNGPTVIDHT
jgi:hypothetical protein